MVYDGLFQELRENLKLQKSTGELPLSKGKAFGQVVLSTALLGCSWVDLGR